MLLKSLIVFGFGMACLASIDPIPTTFYLQPPSGFMLSSIASIGNFSYIIVAMDPKDVNNGNSNLSAINGSSSERSITSSISLLPCRTTLFTFQLNQVSDCVIVICEYPGNSFGPTTFYQIDIDSNGQLSVSKSKTIQPSFEYGTFTTIVQQYENSLLLVGPDSEDGIQRVFILTPNLDLFSLSSLNLTSGTSVLNGVFSYDGTYIVASTFDSKNNIYRLVQLSQPDYGVRELYAQSYTSVFFPVFSLPSSPLVSAGFYIEQVANEKGIEYINYDFGYNYDGAMAMDSHTNYYSNTRIFISRTPFDTVSNCLYLVGSSVVSSGSSILTQIHIEEDVDQPQQIVSQVELNDIPQVKSILSTSSFVFLLTDTTLYRYSVLCPPFASAA